LIEQRAAHVGDQHLDELALLVGGHLLPHIHERLLGVGDRIVALAGRRPEELAGQALAHLRAAGERRRQRVAVGVGAREVVGELRAVGDGRVRLRVHGGQRPVRAQVAVGEGAAHRPRRTLRAHAVEHLEREPDLIDGGVAVGAGCVGRVNVVAIAGRLRRIGRGRNDLDVQRLRIRKLHARDPAHDRDAAQDRRGLLGVREDRKESRLVEDAEALGQVRVRGRARRRHAVDRRQRAVDDAPGRVQQLADRPRRPLHDLVDELPGLGVHRRAHRRRELRVHGGVLGRLRDAVDAQPLAHDAHHAIAPGLRRQQATHLRLTDVRRPQAARRRHVEQRLIGRRPRDEVRQVAGQLLRRQRDGAGAAAAQRCDVEEPDRLQDPARDQVDALVVGTGAVRARVVQRDQVGRLLGRHRAAERLRAERRDERLRASFASRGRVRARRERRELVRGARFRHHRLGRVVQRLGHDRVDPLRVVEGEAAALPRIGREVVRRARRHRGSQQRLHRGVVLGVGHAPDAGRQQHRAPRHGEARAHRARPGARAVATAAVSVAVHRVDARVRAQHLSRGRAPAGAGVTDRSGRARGTARAAVERVVHRVHARARRTLRFAHVAAAALAHVVAAHLPRRALRAAAAAVVLVRHDVVAADDAVPRTHGAREAVAALARRAARAVVAAGATVVVVPAQVLADPRALHLEAFAA